MLQVDDAMDPVSANEDADTVLELNELLAVEDEDALMGSMVVATLDEVSGL